MIENLQRPIILFNCSTNIIGGGVKNSALFIAESLNWTDRIEWVYAVSEEVVKILKSKNIKIDNRFLVFEKSPAKNRQAQRELINFSLACKADLVYTMAGPAYVNFPIFHVQGISSAYITHVKWDIFTINKNIISNLKLGSKIGYQLYKSRIADHFIFQTETARKNYCKRAFIKINKTSVISNAFDSEMQGSVFSKKGDNSIKTIFCPGAPFEHKAFQFIPEIAYQLSLLTANFEFLITLPDSEILQKINNKAISLNVAKYIRNYGPYDYSNIASLYSMADIVFVPSLLETFSATYLEAMIADKVLVVSDRDFALDICEDNACYVNPLDFSNTAKTIFSIIENPDTFKPDVHKRTLVLKKYGNQQQRFENISELLISLYRKQSTNENKTWKE